jgi:hypothetical protein
MRKVKRYNEFLNEEKGFLKNAIIGGAIATSVGTNQVDANTPLGNEPVVPVQVSDTSVVNKDKNKSLISFIDTLEKENPQIIIDDSIESSEPIPFKNNVESLSFLETNLNKFNNTMVSDKLPKLSLSDLDLLSKPGLPFRINYFYVRGLDSQDSGPYLIPILNLSYTKAIDIHNHEVKFNFTRINGQNTFGATLNF